MLVNKKFHMKRSHLTLRREKALYQYDFQLTLEKLVAANTFVLRNGDSCTFHNSYNTILVAETQETFTEEILPPDVNMEDTLKKSRAENISDGNASNDNFVAEIIINELNSFREFQTKTESKLDKLEEAIFTDNSKSDIENVNDNTDFVISLLKRRITSPESELSKKDGIMEFLQDQLVLHSESKFETSINSGIEFKINKDNCNCNNKTVSSNNSVEKDNDKGSL